MRRFVAAALLLAAPAAAQPDTLQGPSLRDYVGCDRFFCARVTWGVGPTVFDAALGVPVSTLQQRVTLAARPGVPDGVYHDVEARLVVRPDPRYGLGAWDGNGYLGRLYLPEGLRVGRPLVLVDEFATGRFYRDAGRPAGPDALEGLLIADPGVDDRQYALAIALTATPEPATLALAGAGVVLLGAWARRRRTA